MNSNLTTRRVFKGLLALVVFGSLALVTYIRATAEPAETRSIEEIERLEGKAVAVSNPEEKTFFDYINADATLRAPRRFNLRSNLSEKVENVAVDVGDTVAAGELLVEFRKEDIKSDISAAETRLDEAEKNYVRFQNLLERGVVSEDAVEARLTALEDARSALQKARSRLEFAEVRAPDREELDYEGGNVQVSAREVDPGEFKSPGQPLVTLTDMSIIELKVQVPESAVKHIAPGLKVEFSLGGDEEWKEAELVRVSPETRDPHRFFVVYARTENVRSDRQWLLRPGMHAVVRIPKDVRESVMAIPTAALRMTEAGCCNVFFVNPNDDDVKNNESVEGVATGVNIEPGLRMEDWVEVISPELGGDEMLILNPRLDISDGDRVRVMEHM